MATPSYESPKPVVLVTGASGNIGRSLVAALTDSYTVIGIDRSEGKADFPHIKADLTDEKSVSAAIGQVARRFGKRIASVVHLAAYFDFTGEENPLYEAVNVEGTRHLLRALQDLEVEQLLYAGTMLVHAPCRPGERIDENQPIAPKWAYPKSKAKAEEVIRAEHGAIPYVLLHLAGLYDEKTAVPTLAHQIALIYERDLTSHLYAGSTLVGQSMVYREDMIDAFRRAIDRRKCIPSGTVILIGEEEPLSYEALQDEIGYLIHGTEEWPTLRLPKPAAAAGAWLQEKLEPVVPDALDQGAKPFVKPFMVAMADDHYALDITRARQLLGWEPKHRLKDVLPAMIAELKRDPKGWYERHGITPPPIIVEATVDGEDPERVRIRHEALLQEQHRRFRWAHFVNIALGAWLVSQPPLIGLEEPPLASSEVALGLATMIFATLSLSWRLRWARWACAAVGALVMAAPFLFWTQNAAAYLSDTLVGALIFGFSVCTRPEVGPSPLAVLTRSETPPDWSYNPSAWSQRLPIILLALSGLQVSRYLAAYQLGHIDTVWEPFFMGSADDPRNGTEEIITSKVSKAWPVSDAALGAYTYVLEILTGIVGSRMRWRTMPWLVLLFGLMIAPLGITSIFFIIIQPVVIGTWSTLALLAAAVLLVQIPYSLDELLATLQFIGRRVRAGKNWLRVFLFGDRDEGEEKEVGDEFDRRPDAILADMWTGSVSLPWNLGLAALVGLWLMLTRLTVGANGIQANVDHVIGSLALTIISLAAAEMARPLRFLLIPLGAALIGSSFICDTRAELFNSVVCGLALIALSLRRGAIHERYGTWQKMII